MNAPATEREKTGQSTSLYLINDHLEGLEKLAVQRRKDTGRNVSISMLVNEAIRQFLLQSTPPQRG